VKVKTDDFDNMNLIEKRIGYLLGARLRDKSRMKKAILKQDKIRSAHKGIKEWNSVSVIRKWRESR